MNSLDDKSCSPKAQNRKNQKIKYLHCHLQRLLPSFVCALIATSPLESLAQKAPSKPVFEVLQIPVSVKNVYGKEISQNIVVTVFTDPSTPEPRPMFVFNHGRSHLPDQRAGMGRVAYSINSNWLASQGFTVIVPTRMGYGVSGGEDVEDSGTCNQKRYPPVYQAAADQSVQILEAMKKHPKYGSQVLHDRTVVMGQSFGGTTAATLASMNPPGVIAAINFAGGGGGNPIDMPKNPCGQWHLKNLFANYGKTAKIPMLWMYTENDMYFGASLPREWFEAYKANLQPQGSAASTAPSVQFIQFPPHGEDGHSLFTRAPEIWRPTLVEFLNAQGFAHVKLK